MCAVSHHLRGRSLYGLIITAPRQVDTTKNRNMLPTLDEEAEGAYAHRRAKALSSDMKTLAQVCIILIRMRSENQS